MPKGVKITLALLTLASIILLCTTIIFYLSKENEKEKKVFLQKSLDETVSAKQDLENRLKEVEIMNAELKAAIKSHEEKMNTLSQDLEKERAANVESSAKIQERESEIERLKLRIEDEKEEKEDLIKRFERLTEDYLNMKFQLDNLLRVKEELEKKARELAEREDVSLGKIVIKQPVK